MSTEVYRAIALLFVMTSPSAQLTQNRRRCQVSSHNWKGLPTCKIICGRAKVLTIRKGTLQEILEMTNLATLLIALFCIRLAIYKSAAPSPILKSCKEEGSSMYFDWSNWYSSWIGQRTSSCEQKHNINEKKLLSGAALSLPHWSFCCLTGLWPPRSSPAGLSRKTAWRSSLGDYLMTFRKVPSKNRFFEIR